MDSKKTNLTPELKEIYDRVMNTPGGNASSVTGALPTSSSPSVAPTLQNPLPASPSLGAQMPSMPQTSMGASPDLMAPTNNTPVMPPPLPSSPQMPSLGAIPSVGEPTPAEQALSNAPARPISEGNTFAFSGTAKPGTTAPTAPESKDTKKKAKISKPILIVLGIVFIAVWGVFWAIILGIIQR